jgi:hypothetical protein
VSPLYTHFSMFLSCSHSRQTVLSNNWPLSLSDSIYTIKSFGHVKMQVVIAFWSSTESFIIQSAIGWFDVLTIQLVIWHTTMLTTWVQFSLEALRCFF